MAFMDIPTLLDFTWSALAGGVLYDGVKKSLGAAYKPLANYQQSNQKTEFNAALQMLLETNDEIKNSLIELASGKQTDVKGKNIVTGNIKADKNANVIIGDNNKVTR